MMNMSIHDIKSIKQSKIESRQLSTSGKYYFVSHLNITTEDNKVFEITLFSDNSDSLKIERE